MQLIKEEIMVIACTDARSLFMPWLFPRRLGFPCHVSNPSSFSSQPSILHILRSFSSEPSILYDCHLPTSSTLGEPKFPFVLRSLQACLYKYKTIITIRVRWRVRDLWLWTLARRGVATC
jgi:hypothetical protein